MVKLTVPPNIIGTPGADLIEGIWSGNVSGIHIGIEILTGGTINTGLGNDTIKGEASGGYPSIGISNSGTINTGDGIDTITGSAIGAFVTRGLLPGIGILNNATGIINLGRGNDRITGTGTGGGGGQTSFGISNLGQIHGDVGNDEITGIAIGAGAWSRATGISNSGSIRGGTGNDTITGDGTGDRNIYGVGGEGTGISNTGLISGDEGKDYIIGTGTGNQGGPYGGPGTGRGGRGIGILNTGNVSGGTADDVITGIGKGGQGVLSIGGDGIGISNSAFIRGEGGNDIITGIGLGGVSDTNSSGRGVGISNIAGVIDVGSGHDKIFGYGTTTGIEGNGVNTIGMDGGADNDYFTARKIDGLDSLNRPIISANQDGAIANIFINGGAGHDIFDVGFGSAKLDGGQGFDILVLQTLGSGVYNIGTPGVDGWLEITNTASSNTLLVRNMELISFGAVTVV